MKKRFTRILAALVLLVGLTIPMGMWGQAPVNTVLWGEIWTDGGNAQPSAYGFTGTTVYGNATLTYSNSSTSTKLYNETLAGGTAPELLLAKNNSTWTITGIPSGSATGLTLSFKANYDRTVVSTTTEGVNVGDKTFSNNTVSYPISVTSSVSSFVLVFTNTSGSNVRIDDIQLVVTTAGGGPQLTSTTTTITAPENFNNDLYVGTSAGTLTASVTETNGGAAVSGATVTWSSSNTSVATIDENGAVTLVAAGTTTIRATYAGNATYSSSYDDYELTVTSSAPVADVTFVAGTDVGTSSSNNTPDSMTKSGVIVSSTDAAFATAEYRLYQNSETTISAQGYIITSIVFTGCENSKPVSNLSLTAGSTGSYSVSNNVGTWTGSATSVSFTASAQARASKIEIWMHPDNTPSVTVTPSTINAPFGGAEGTLEVTIENIPNLISVDYYFCDANGEGLQEDPDGITVEIQEDNGVYSVGYDIDANEGAARTIYFKVYTEVNGEEVYAIVTVNQAAAPQSYTLTVATLNNHINGIFVFNATDETNPLIAEGAAGSVQVPEGTEIRISPDVESPYVLGTLTVVDGNNVQVTLTTISEGYYSFNMPSSTVTISATAVEASVVATYTLVTSASQLVAGKSYIIVASNNDQREHSYAMGSYSNNYRLKVDIDDYISADKTTITGNDGVREVVLGGSTGNWTFYESTDNAYLKGYNGGSLYNYTPNPEQPNTLDDACYWTIIMEDGYAKIESNKYNTSNNYDDDFYIMYNSNQPRFACYKGTQHWTYLYVKEETFTLDIAQYTSGQKNGWYLIASPVSVDLTTNTMVSGTYDLYRFNPTVDLEWENYKAMENNQPLHPDFTTLEVGRGYLYANGNNVQLSFTGVPSNNGEVTMPYVGWNLVGNPLSTAATITNDYYRMNDTHTGIMTEAGTGNIARMEGVFVKATQANQTVNFTPVQEGNNNGNSAVVMNLSQYRGGVIDRAIVRIGEGRQMTKFTLFENNTKLYIPQDDDDYAIVRSEAQGELPVNFRAAENGTYTLSMDVENVDMNYLHLIDNMTGMDIDLLQTPSYTFEANVNDYESRFRLVFAGASTGSATDDSFAFYSNGNLIINNEGNATLQVIDINGRILSSETISGSCSKAINATTGVYMLRLINGDNVKVQKVVVR